ncbi:MAG: hypothetical protein HPY85_16700 [Anaerolineae bacterium]|nr:hypothetical protein [Anaerolineae bacterium]
MAGEPFSRCPACPIPDVGSEMALSAASIPTSGMAWSSETPIGLIGTPGVEPSMGCQKDDRVHAWMCAWGYVCNTIRLFQVTSGKENVLNEFTSRLPRLNNMD